jgi:hypothetical protein
LTNRLKSIESTIEDKRKWDERQKALKKLTDFRDSFQRETDPAQARQYITQSEALAASYSADPEFSQVVEDVRHQVTSSEMAHAALKQDRFEDCLEQCAWVLSRMRHHQLFLNLKKQAEERELSLADAYADSVSQVKALLAAGKLVEAEALCNKASAQLPHFSDWQELKQEIASRQKEDPKGQENADNVRRLLERGERSLRDNQYRLAEQAFSSALKLSPDDKKLSGHLVGLLFGYARSIVRENPQSAEEVLQLTARLLPGTPVPQDLTEAVKEKREHAKEEAVRWASLDKISNLNAQVESAKNRDALQAARAEAAKHGFASAGHADVREAALALNEKIEAKSTVFEARQARRPILLSRTLAVAATLIVAVGLAYWLNNAHPSAPTVQKPEETVATAKPPVVPPAPPATTASTLAPAAPAAPSTGSLIIRSQVPGAKVEVGGKQYTVSDEPLKVELNAKSYQVTGTHPGYKDFGPVTVEVGKSAETVLDVQLTPKPANLELRGIVPDTRVKLDGVLLGKAVAYEALTKELPAGEHSIELSRNGFVTRTLTRNLAPGQSLVLSDRDVHLESTDAQTLAEAAKHASAAPGSPVKAEDLQWQSLDKNDPEALRAYVAKYPSSSWSNEAKQRIEGTLLAREEGDWNNTDHTNAPALQDFLRKHPESVHASAAASALADLDRKTRAAQAQSAEELAWKKVNHRDETSLMSYLREYPASRYRNTAEGDLASIHLSSASANESAAVLGVLSRLANAWSARDLDSILAIQKNLDKRKVKAELSHVKELAMHISAASPPQIEGAQAVVLCRRQASQTFSDGTHKQIPESIVSYLLIKQDGNWTIEGTR